MRVSLPVVEQADHLAQKHGVTQARMVPIIRQYIQFGLVGMSNAIADLGVLNALLFVHPARNTFDLVAENTVAVSVAIANSYWWNTRWTFRAQMTHTRREQVLFVAQALLNVTINNVVLVVVNMMLPGSAALSVQIANNIAKIFAMVAASTVSFLLLRSVVFVPQVLRASAPPAKSRHTRPTDSSRD